MGGGGGDREWTENGPELQTWIYDYLNHKLSQNSKCGNCAYKSRARKPSSLIHKRAFWEYKLPLKKSVQNATKQICTVQWSQVFTKASCQPHHNQLWEIVNAIVCSNCASSKSSIRTMSVFPAWKWWNHFKPVVKCQ